MMAALQDDVLNCKDVEQDHSFLQLSAHETIEDLHMTEVAVDPDSMDKEMLRRIKRKERTKLNRKRKKALQRNLNQVNASELQQSVSALATTIGINTSSLVNDPLNGSCNREAFIVQNSGSVLAVDDHGLQSNNAEGSDFIPPSRATTEIPLCVMDASNFNAKLSNLDLIYITDYLEKNIFKDLTSVSKLKIENIYLSASRRVWIICSSSTTLNWVIRRVSEMPSFNGRKFAVHTLAELEVMTQVSVLVPKECSLVNEYNDLMLLLTLQNPGFNRGLTTQELKKRGTAERVLQDLNNEEEATGEDSSGGKAANDVQNNAVGEENLSDMKSDLEDGVNGTPATTSSQPITKVEVVSPLKQAGSNSTANGSTGASSEVEKPLPAPRSRTYVFFADDVWLGELRRLGCRPYLGARRLLCVIGERLVQRSQDGAISTAAKKRRRGGKRLAGGVGGQRAGKTDSESGQDSAPPAAVMDGMLALA